MIGLMVVDDEEGVRRSLKKVLEKDGYTVIPLENGTQAIQAIRKRENPIEIVISDYKMPGIDGLETLIEIGKLDPEITRIMLTGYATMESAIEAVNAGIDGFLTKPFENLELRAKVREYSLKKRLKQFVSEQIFAALQKEAQAMLPRRQEVTVLFCDIRGFAGLSQEMSPQDISEMLNRDYYSPLDQAIFEFNGTLDKHVGDAIMAVFGAPIHYLDDPQRAVSCAIRMRDRMSEINEIRGGDGKRIDVGIGIATGEVMAGIFGSMHKKEYTVFGAPVNLASRLEGLAKRNQILICEQTYEHVRDRVNTEEIKSLAIKGLDRVCVAYNVLGEKYILTNSGPVI